MLLLVAGGWFRRGRRPRCARDPLPLAPLAHLLSFWTLLVTGGLFAMLTAVELVAHFGFGFPLDRITIVLTWVMGILSPLCLRLSYAFWLRLRH